MGTPSRAETPVSVVVPTYGRSDLLEDALRSIEAQTYPEVELIVVDDYSPIPVEHLIADMDLSIDEVRCLRHEENRGANAARNTGIQEASGDVIAFLDDDDRWDPSYLARVVAAFDDPDIGLVSAGARVIDADGNRIGVHRPSFTPDPMEDLLDGALVGSFSRFAVRASAVDEVGLLDERLPSWQDWEWQFRFARQYRFAAVSEPLVTHRHGDHEQITDDFEQRRDVSYPVLLERNREAIASRSLRDERRFLGVLARSLAASALHNGAYLSGICWLLRAVRHDPTGVEAYVYLAAAAGGPITYRPLRWLKRSFGGRGAP